LVDGSIREARFNELLLETIDDSLDRLFGGKAGNLVYSFLKTAASLDREDITSDLVGFDAGLGKLLGSGATVLERHRERAVFQTRPKCSNRRLVHKTD